MALDQKSLLDASHFLAFLGGTAVGCIGQYLTDRFTDKRRKKEKESEVDSTFMSFKRDMPKLFEEMATDLRGDESNAIREFVIAPNKRVMFNGNKPRFMYFQEDEPYLQAYVDRLEAAGYVTDVRTGNAPIYRMSEQFVQLLRANA